MDISVSQQSFHNTYTECYIECIGEAETTNKNRKKNTRTHSQASERAPIGLAIDIRMEVSRSFTQYQHSIGIVTLSTQTQTHTERVQSPAFQHVFSERVFSFVELICCAHTGKWLKWGKVKIKIIEDDDDDDDRRRRRRNRKQKKNKFDRIVYGRVCVLFVCTITFYNTKCTFPTLSPFEAPASQPANQPVFTSLSCCAILLCILNGVKIKTENKPIQPIGRSKCFDSLIDRVSSHTWRHQNIYSEIAQYNWMLFVYTVISTFTVYKQTTCLLLN